MGRLIQILIVLLALQVILFVALDRTQPNLAAVSERAAMVDIDEKAVTRLVITSSAASEGDTGTDASQGSKGSTTAGWSAYIGSTIKTASPSWLE